MSHIVDITGQRFGRLVAIEKAPRAAYYSSYRNARWRCRCDCGAETVVSSHSLRYGFTRSCGCLRSDRMKDIHKAEREARSR